ncbi:MAG: hypothetical protein J6Y88_00745 [Bacteroidales bacterium]|nr:hypothetical protein [Bacteroidales bacterium]
MKYFVRAVKYLIYFTILFLIIVAILCVVLHHPLSHFAALFKEGAMWQIAVLFAVIAAVYPMLGFRKNHITLDGPFSDYHDIIKKTMDDADFVLEKDDDEKMVFRQKRGYLRFTRMWEDAVTFFKGEDRIYVDGPIKDTTRLISNIYYNYRQSHPKDQY